MTWRIQFYNRRRGTLAQYDVDAATPAEALVLGRNALVAEHRPVTARRPASLFERAETIGGQPSGGWVLYRIVNDASPR
jgi:hypothetical protein